jgi:large subunit ribosomal protein L13
VAGHRRQGPRGRPARFDHRHAPARQAQGEFHAPSGYIGGIKERSAKSILEGKFPERIVEKAVERMLPRGPLGKKQLTNLRVYKGPDHPHAAQAPTVLDVGKLNPKNSRSAEING